MEKNYDFYLAGPFFTREQSKQQDIIEIFMDLANKTYFSPRLDAGKLPNNPTQEEMREVFLADLEGIDNCDMLFANISYKDTGTCVEIGYALANDIPVILFWDEDNHQDGAKLNLMLVGAVNGSVITSLEELGNFLQTGELPDSHDLFDIE